jgi:DNA-binding SARP family transcriptional activator
MDFRILGPLEVEAEGRQVALRGPRQRALLAVLLLHAGEALSTDRLIELLWGDRPPAGARKALSVRVSELRKTVGHDVIATRPGGYAIEIEPDRLDLRRFEALCAAGREALAGPRADVASQRLSEALALWRGPPLADLAFEPFAQHEIPRLEELRIAAIEDRIDADLDLGRHGELTAELRHLVHEHPLHERLWRQLMLALYRCGRQADALAAYRDARRMLVDELGIEPGRALRDLEAAILAQDPALDRPARPDPATRGTPFVGRELELEGLLADLAAAESGRGRLVLVGGEPGIGKTRLAEELAARAADRGHAVLVGRCWEVGGAPPYWPWAQALRAHVREQDPTALQALLGAGASVVAQLVPEVRERLGELPEPDELPPEGARFRLFDAVAAFLRSAARSRPILVVLDDLHAADASSLLLLEFVAAELDHAGLMIVAAYRHNEPADALSSTLGELVRRPAVRRLVLEGLSQDAVADYLRARTGITAPDSLVAALHRGSDGNPLFLGELAPALVAAGSEAEPLERLPIPSGIKEAIARRLSRLSHDCVVLLEIASVLGREFAVAPLERVSGVAGATLLERLDEAVAAGVIGGAPAARGRLRFSHALVRDALYDALGAARRAALHGQVGDALAELHKHDVEPHLAEIAHHFCEAAPAGERERAVEFARRAADRAGRLLAYEEAARLYGMALDVLDESAHGRAACDLRLALGEAQARAGDLATARTSFLAAAAHARHASDAPLLARAALGYGGRLVWVRSDDEHLIPLLQEALTALGGQHVESRVRVMTRLCGALRGVRSSAAERRRLSAEAVDLARASGDAATLAYALEGRYVTLYDTPSEPLADRLAVAEEMTRLALELGDRERAVHGRFGRMIGLLEGGDVRPAKAELEAMRQLAESLRQPAQRWMCIASAASIALFEGRLPEAEAAIEEAVQAGGLAQRMEVVFTARIQRVVLRRHQGRAADLGVELARCLEDHPHRLLVHALSAQLTGDRAAFKRLTDQLDDLTVDNDWLPSLTLLAELAEHFGDAPRSQRLYERLEPYAQRNALNVPEIMTGSVSRSLGLLAAAMGDRAGAREHFATALEMNAAMGARPWYELALDDRRRLLGD